MFKSKLLSADSRTSRRFRSFGLIKYSLASKASGKTSLSNPRDISSGGTSFVCDETLPMHSMLELDIYLPPLDDFIMAIGKVVNSFLVKGTDRHLVGVQFTAMDPENKKRLSSYIEGIAKDSRMQRYLDKKGKYFKRSLYEERFLKSGNQ